MSRPRDPASATVGRPTGRTSRLLIRSDRGARKPEKRRFPNLCYTRGRYCICRQKRERRRKRRVFDRRPRGLALACLPSIQYAEAKILTHRPMRTTSRDNRRHRNQKLGCSFPRLKMSGRCAAEPLRRAQTRWDEKRACGNKLWGALRSRDSSAPSSFEPCRPLFCRCKLDVGAGIPRRPWPVPGRSG